MQPVLEIPPRLKNKPVPDQIIKSVNRMLSSTWLLLLEHYTFFSLSFSHFKLQFPCLAMAASTNPTTCSVFTTPDLWGKDLETLTMSLQWVYCCFFFIFKTCMKMIPFLSWVRKHNSNYVMLHRIIFHDSLRHRWTSLTQKEFMIGSTAE